MELVLILIIALLNLFLMKEEYTITFATSFGNICNYKIKFQLFWSLLQVCYNYLEFHPRWFLSLFSSMNMLICPINHNSHQVSCTLKGILW